jgi:hypothetical protein
MTRAMKWWGGVVASGLVLLAGVTTAWAQTNMFPASGNVGIGTTSPNRNLSIVAPAAGDAIMEFARDNVNTNGLFLMRTVTGNVNDWLFGTRNGSTDFRVFSYGLNADVMSINKSTGYVGIGTTSPANALSLDSLTQTSDVILQINRPTSSFNGTIMLKTNGTNDFLLGARGGSPDFKVFSFGLGADALTVSRATGDITLTSNVTVGGNIAAKYQDVAEWVKTPRPLAAATVVVIDPSANDQVLASTQPYDTRVAGVVSTRPGLLLGEASEDKVQVAHSGRVKVKVDASYGAIGVGDLLTTSPTPGHAMRAEPVTIAGVAIQRPGTLVGKALEPLKEGQGEILVLLTLQ